MNKTHGACECGSTQVTISLPESLQNYSPRLCDCDFCTSRGIAYLSDPEGKLEIESSKTLQLQRQGSNQADFITCSECQTVIAASVQLSDKVIGALNSTLLKQASNLQPATTVSPKKLAPADKLERWTALWLTIRVNGNSYLKQSF